MVFSRRDAFLSKYYLIIFILIAVFTMMMPSPVFAASLPKDIWTHWSGGWVAALMEKGILESPLGDRYFPYRGLSREEAALLLYRLATLQKQGVADPSLCPYQDIRGLGGEQAIVALYKAGILDEGEKFLPHQEIKRIEMVRYAARWLKKFSNPTSQPSGLTPSQNGGGASEWPEPISANSSSEEFSPAAKNGRAAFKDVKDGADAGYVEFLYGQGMISGSEDGLFYPDKSMARGEAAVLLCKLIGLEPIKAKPDSLPQKKVIEPFYVSQLSPVYAPVSCEPTAVFMGLKTKGYAQDIDAKVFLDKMPKSECDPSKGFVGTPYSPMYRDSKRITIYPPVLAEYAKQYGKVVDISGAPPKEIQREVLSGNPVAVYSTLYWKKPVYRWFDIEGKKQRLLSNNHAVLVCGYDSEAKQYYIADPYNKDNPQKPLLYWIKQSVFDPLYSERCHAIVIE